MKGWPATPRNLGLCSSDISTRTLAGVMALGEAGMIVTGGSMQFSRRSCLSLLALALFAPAAGAATQGYPNKPVRLVVADAPGGAPDQLGRLLAQKLGDGLGQQVIVDNRAGAGGVLGAEMVAKSPADG